ncbi:MULTISPECIES: type II toxin-antitoxin system PemK/MazF family toxin [unclassified Endozoicomonas]|uniref:type II toxin-antitoxin system PemK/MazF family toxin n=2 Tax=Endozoicomonas TaxID=305899 RepID=UPI0021477183|nr:MULTISPECIES: type II toxin-antitoxin system PemK/MazF family toxin [unclassified Endozoicomonas]
MYIPERGDIVLINFEPGSGREIMKTRPGYVLSRRLLNQHTGLAIIAPVTSTIRGVKLEVLLTKTMTTHGSILVHQMKSMDFECRGARFVEKSPESVIDQVDKIAKVIIS